MRKTINTATILFLCMISCTIYAQNTTYGYVKVGGGGYVTSVIESLTEDNVIYAKTDVGGIFKWNETTKVWKPLHEWLGPNLTSFMGTEAFAIDPNEPNKIYAVGGTSYWNDGVTAVMRSSDRGETWQYTNVSSLFKANGNGSDRQKGETLAVDPNNGKILYFGSRYNNGLFRSTDAGVTWSRVTTFPDSIGLRSSFSFVHFDYDSSTANGSSTIYVGNFKTGNNIHVSRDFGATWQSIGGYTGGKPQRVATSPFIRDLYITYTSNGAVLKYNMTNKTWLNITPSTGRSYSGIAVDQTETGSNKIVATTYNYWASQQPWGYGDEVYYSSNGGISWTNKNAVDKCTMENNGIGWMEKRSMHWVGSACMSHAKPGKVFIVSGNGIFATDNIEATKPAWKVVSHGLEETVLINQGMISIPNGPLISTFGDINGFVHTNIHEYPTKTLSQSVSFAYAPLNPSTIVRTINLERRKDGVVLADSSAVVLSEDNGATWKQLPPLPVNIKAGTTSISADGKTILWKGNNTTLGTVLYWTENKGVTWTKTAIMPTNSTPIPDAVNPQRFYLFNTSNGYMYRSDDGARTFSAKGYVSTGGSSVLKFALGKENHVWMNNNGKIKYSEDGGLTFTTCSNYSCSSFALGKEAPGKDYPTIFMWGRSTSSTSTPEGMYRSIDKGQTWVRVNDDAHQWGHLANAGTIEADKNVYGLVYKSTAGMGMPWMGIEGFTAIDKVENYKVDVEICPTIFTNTCTLKSKNSNIKSIAIYNLQGAMVETIQTDIYKNESIELGEKLEKGAYFIKVIDNYGSSTFKAVKK